MRAKHIFAALAIPAFLAACSSEDDFTLNKTPELAGRKVIDTDLVFDFKSGADTRLTIGDDAIVLDNKDKVAAALIDEVTGTEGDVNGYYITEGIATNHPFAKTSTGWSTPSRLVEGNYLFYYQYQEGLGGARKAAVPYSIGKTQYAYTKDAPTVFVGDQAVKDNAMGIGYAFLKADEGITPSQVKVQMYNLFAFLKFNISTDKSGLEVQQILVKRTNDAKFMLSGTINNSNIAARGSKTADGKTEGSDNNPLNAGVLVGENEKKYTTDYADEGEDQAAYVILSLPDLKASGTKQAAYVVIPADEYASTKDEEADATKSSEFIIDVYTNQGVFTKNVELSKVGAEEENYSKLTMGKVQPIALNITGTLKAADKYFVGSNEQWQKVLKSLPALAANATATQKELNIEVLNDVKLTKADIDLIQTTNAKDYTITVTGSPLIMTESCALSNITIATLKVEPSVTVDLGNKAVIAMLDNAGTVNINTVEEKESVAKITELNNNGVVNVNASAAITTLTNGKPGATKPDFSTVKLNVKANLTITTLTNNAGDKIAGNATVVVDEGKTLTIGTGTNNGTIDNSGQIIADGVFENTGIKALINNKATGVLSNINGENKKVENLQGANIQAMAGSTTIVADNTGSTITYEDGANVSVTGDGVEKGKIAYVITEKYLVPTAGVEYNTIVVDGLSIKLNTKADNNEIFKMPSTTGITNVVIKNAATVDMSMLDMAEGGELTLIEVEGSSNKIIAAGIITGTLKVSDEGYLLIPLNSEVTTTTLTNKGTINVGGALNYDSSSENNAEGMLLGTGKIIDTKSE